MKPNLNNAALKMSAGLPKQFPADRLPQVAFSGRSNVGKSSLINSLLGRKSLARVSGEPGKTITVNFYDIDKKLYLVDLPGYGYAKRSPEEKKRWSALTDGYFTKNPNIDSLKLVCQLIDSRTGPTADDLDMLYYLRETGKDRQAQRDGDRGIPRCRRRRSSDKGSAAHPLFREDQPRPGRALAQDL